MKKPVVLTSDLPAFFRLQTDPSLAECSFSRKLTQDSSCSARRVKNCDRLPQGLLHKGSGYSGAFARADRRLSGRLRDGKAFIRPSY
jgi:hypothetical protein